MITVNLKYDDAEKPKINDNWIQSICEKIFMDCKKNMVTITIIFSNDLQLRKLNNEYFGEDTDTDTISFNLEENGEPIEGEVYISVERVSENAHIYKQNFITECKRVIIHGCLHLLGYNDRSPVDKKRMTNLEEIYLSHRINVKQI